MFPLSLFAEELIGSQIGNFLFCVCLVNSIFGAIGSTIARSYRNIFRKKKFEDPVSSKGNNGSNQGESWSIEDYDYDDDDDDDDIALSTKSVSPPMTPPSSKKKKKNTTPKKDARSMQSPNSYKKTTMHSSKTKKILRKEAMARAKQYGQYDKQRVDAVKRMRVEQQDFNRTN